MKRHLTIRILAGFAFAAVAFAQAPLQPRAAVAKPAKTVVDAKQHDTARISVKFRDDLPVRIRNGKLGAEGPKANALNPAGALLNRLQAAGARWERQHPTAEEKLTEMREKAQRNTGKAMPDLNTAYILHLPKGTKAEQIIDELNALDAIEIALPMPLPAPDPVVGNYEPQQGYLNPAPGGVDARFAWTQPAGAGGNVWIADIESNWNFNHTDLNPPTLLGQPSTLTGQDNIDHGTAVLGILGGRNNGVGVTGIAYNSTLFVAARQTAAGFNPAGAITTATAALRPGDIIVLEMQTDGPFPGNDDLVPIEWDQNVYNAVRVAVGNGIIVVEAAGNGSQNLDDPAYNTGHSPFRADHDSGAIIVGAGGVTGGSGDRSRLNFSSFGSTVDLQGWGERVVTTGYGDLYDDDGMNSFYTAIFNGTSSATPTVAGACAAIQAHYKLNNFGAVLTPFEMREVLRATGSPQLDGSESRGGTYSQSGTTVTRKTGSAMFSTADINSFVRFSGGQQAMITALVSATEVTVDVSQDVPETTITLRRFATQNIGPRPNLQAAFFVTESATWVDLNYGGAETGSFVQPFNTFFEGINAVPAGGNVIIKGGSTPFTGTITKELTLKTYGNSTTIGQ